MSLGKFIVPELILGVQGYTLSSFSQLVTYNRGKKMDTFLSYLCLRLENEHLNNVGEYRAFKSLPLPFITYDEKVGKHE